MKMNDIVNESAELTPQQKQLAHYGRILMNQSSTTKDMELANVMSRVGNELSSFGELFAARTMAELVQKTGTKEIIIKTQYEATRHIRNLLVSDYKPYNIELWNDFF